LKLSAYSGGLAGAAYFFAADAASKSTGAVVDVDAGDDESFTR